MTTQLTVLYESSCLYTKIHKHRVFLICIRVNVDSSNSVQLQISHLVNSVHQLCVSVSTKHQRNRQSPAAVVLQSVGSEPDGDVQTRDVKTHFLSPLRPSDQVQWLKRVQAVIISKATALHPKPADDSISAR